MFCGGDIGLGKYDGDFQYKMLFSIRMRGGTPDPQCLSVYLPFSIFSGVELELCLLSENEKILI